MSTADLPNDIQNATPADAVPVQQNYAYIEQYLNTEVIRRDGSVAMTAPLSLSGTPTQPTQAANKQYVDASIPKIPQSFTTTGAGAIGFIGPEANIGSLVVPAQTVAGMLMVWGLLLVQKTLASDTFDVRLRDTNLAGASLGLARIVVGGTESSASPQGRVATVAGVAKTVIMTINRSLGTGSATFFANAEVNRIDVLWIPVA